MRVIAAVFDPSTRGDPTRFSKGRLIGSDLVDANQRDDPQIPLPVDAAHIREDPDDCLRK
mgnify:CR=1 FL=1